MPGKAGRVRVWDTDKRYLANSTLASLMKDFPVAPILRISRQLAVNRDRVKRLDLQDKAVVFRYREGEKSLYVGGRYFNEVRDRL